VNSLRIDRHEGHGRGRGGPHSQLWLRRRARARARRPRVVAALDWSRRDSRRSPRVVVRSRVTRRTPRLGVCSPRPCATRRWRRAARPCRSSAAGRRRRAARCPHCL